MKGFTGVAVFPGILVPARLEIEAELWPEPVQIQTVGSDRIVVVIQLPVKRFAKIVIAILIPHVTFLKVPQIILIAGDIQIQFGKKTQRDRLMMAHAEPITIVVGAQDLLTVIAVTITIA